MTNSHGGGELAMEGMISLALSVVRFFEDIPFGDFTVSLSIFSPCINCGIGILGRFQDQVVIYPGGSCQHRLALGTG